MASPVLRSAYPTPVQSFERMKRLRFADVDYNLRAVLGEPLQRIVTCMNKSSTEYPMLIISKMDHPRLFGKLKIYSIPPLIYPAKIVTEDFEPYVHTDTEIKLDEVRRKGSKYYLEESQEHVNGYRLYYTSLGNFILVGKEKAERLSVAGKSLMPPHLGSEERRQRWVR
jgi:hypothetical protein